MLKSILHFLIGGLLEAIVIVVSICMLLYVFVAAPHIVDGHSMDVSFTNGDMYIANKFVYDLHDPQRGDVIVLRFDETHDYIKRIVGLPGETIRVSGGSLFINSKQVDESAYVTTGNYTYGLDFLPNDQDIIVPAGDYFVMGDNREGSSDSRQWGFVARSQIEGKATFVFWPFGDIQIVPHITYVDQNGELVAHKS